MAIPQSDEELYNQRYKTETAPLTEQARRQQALLAMSNKNAAGATSGAMATAGARISGETARAMSDVGSKIGTDIYQTNKAQELQKEQMAQQASQFGQSLAEQKASREQSGTQFGQSLTEQQASRQQSGQQFGQTLAQQAEQFAKSQGMTQQQIDAQKAQFGESLGFSKEQLASQEKISANTLAQQAGQFGQTMGLQTKQFEAQQQQINDNLKTQGWNRDASGNLAYAGGQIYDPVTKAMVDPSKLNRPVTQDDIARTSAYINTQVQQQLSAPNPQAEAQQTQGLKDFYQKDPNSFVNKFMGDAAGQIMGNENINKQAVAQALSSGNIDQLKNVIKQGIGGSYGAGDVDNRVALIANNLKNLWDNPTR